MSEIEKLDLRSMDIIGEQKEKLRQLFPEVFTENKIDFEKLKLTLGEAIEVGKERYGMTWPGKADCFKIIQNSSIGTLKPCREESVNFDTTENLFIEGDNLEVLKLLQKSYYAKVKMIYIDPPYNTGNDFIYPDDYKENLTTYLRYTGQVDAGGKRFSTNTDTEGRFHSKWMNMMYPRLFLAKNLLRDDGVIFISIGQTEISNLLLLCNEIFGEENKIRIITRLMKKGGSKGRYFSPNTEYILVYCRSIEQVKDFRLPLEQSFIDKIYIQIEKNGPNKDERFREMGLYQAGLDIRSNQRYWIKCPDGTYVIPPGRAIPQKISEGEQVKPEKGDGVWRWTYERYKQELQLNNIVFKKTDTSSLRDEKGNQSKRNIYTKIWLKDRLEEGRVPVDYIDKFENRLSSRELKELDIPFDFAKPKGLIKNLVEIIDFQTDDIVLDFFAGSATTAHAVIDLNKEDCGNRKFIMIQLPELCDENSEAFKAGFKNISDIGKERIRRVIKNIEKEKDGTLFKDKELNLGFKVFKLDKSNFKIWDTEQISPDKASIEKQLELHINHIDYKASQDDILYEILLKAGFELTTKIEKIKLAGEAVYSIEGGAMFICLEKELTKEAIKAMAEKQPSRVICLDQGFANNDQLKTNAVQIMKSKGVDDFRTV